MTFVGFIGNPRNKNQCLLADRGRFVILHLYPEIFYMISSFSTFASKVSYSGIKKNIYIYIYIIILGPNVPKLGFRVDFLPLLRTPGLEAPTDPVFKPYGLHGLQVGGSPLTYIHGGSGGRQALPTRMGN